VSGLGGLSRRRALAGAGTLLFAPLSGCFIFGEPSPVVGFISLRSAESAAAVDNLDALRRGLAEQGFVEGDSVAIECRYADGQLDLVPVLAQQLVALDVAAIVVATREGARRAQTVMGATPIVFTQATDASDQTGDIGPTVTGIANVGNLDPKRLRLLNELLPPGAKIAFVGDPTLGNYARDLAEIQEAAARLHRPLAVFAVGNDTELAMAYHKLSGTDLGGLIVSSVHGLRGHPEKIVALAARRKLPAIYFDRSFVDAGGLMSYGADFAEVYRQAGIYVGRILNGAQPRGLPVLDPHAAELVVNAATARAQGLTIPPDILSGASQVIG
jgi:putative tryptophan/tyrosine transport system substrate-binding protein